MSDRPRISVSLDLDSGAYTLAVTSYGSTMPAGPRLFRAPPHPPVAFQHDNQESADRDAATLQAYLDALPEAKRKKKAGARGAFSD